MTTTLLERSQIPIIQPPSSTILPQNPACPTEQGALPALSSIPIPRNINAMVSTGSNATNQAIVECCAPSPVHLTDGCSYLWCEVAARYLRNGSASASQNDIVADMSGCMAAVIRRDNLTVDAPAGVGRGLTWQFRGGGGRGVAGVTVRGVGMWVLLVSGVMFVL